MNKLFLTLSMLPLLLLSGCFLNGHPIYIAQISCYQDEQMLSGSLKYFVDETWRDYPPSRLKRTNIYYAINVNKNLPLRISFVVYSPDVTIQYMHLTLNKNFISETYNSALATVNEKIDNLTYTDYLIDNISPYYNVVKVYGWLTDQGPKYLGALSPNTNYVLSGVMINIAA